MSQDRKHEYRINVKLRRRSQPAFDSNRAELKSEDYDDDMDFCQAVATEMLEQLKADRDFLEGKDSDDDADDN